MKINKILWFTSLWTLLLVGMVFGVADEPPDLKLYYDCEEGSGTNVIDYASDNNGTSNAMVYNSSTMSYNISGTGGSYSCGFTGVDDNNIAVPDLNDEIGWADGFAMKMDVQPRIGINGEACYLYTGFGEYRFSFGIDQWSGNANVYQMAIDVGSWEGLCLGSNNYSDNTYRQIIFDYTGTNLTIYIDGVPECSDLTSGNPIDDASSQNRVGHSDNTGDDLECDANIDEIKVYNRSLTKGEIQNLTNYGSTQIPDVSPTLPANITLRFPENETTHSINPLNITFAYFNYDADSCSGISNLSGSFNTTATAVEGFNYSLNYTFPMNTRSQTVSWRVNCSNSSGESIVSETRIFYYDNDFTSPTISWNYPTTDNDTINLDIILNISTDEIIDCDVNMTEFNLVSSGATEYILNESTLDNGFYSIFVNCTDKSTHQNKANLSLTFTKDKQYPTISFASPSENNQSYFINLEFIDVEFTLTDNRDLYSYEINITENSTGNLWYSKNATITGGNYSFSESIYSLNQTNTTHYISVATCDSHTDKDFKDAKSILKSDNKIKYRFDDTIIEIFTDEVGTDGVDTKKLKDRYDFTFRFKDTKDKRIFKIHSNERIDYLSHTRYKGHFVVGEKYWVDFEGLGDVFVEEMTNNTYKITVETLGLKDLTFKSIGGLNCYSKIVYFELRKKESPYGLKYLAGTKLFNHDALDITTTSGVLMLFFIFAILIALVVFGEYSKIPAVEVFTGMLGFFFGLLITGLISTIIGVILIILSILYMIRGIGEARN